MPDFPLPRIRKEIQDYARSSEHLLAAATTPDNAPFSQEELDLIEYYITELVHRILPQAKAS